MILISRDIANGLLDVLLGAHHDNAADLYHHVFGLLDADQLPAISHAPIFVSKTQVLEWRKERMAYHHCEDGHDHVTPFDGLLYQHVPYDQHTQRLRGAISNLKWSEVPLAKLEAIAAVLCEYGS